MNPQCSFSHPRAPAAKPPPPPLVDPAKKSKFKWVAVTPNEEQTATEGQEAEGQEATEEAQTDKTEDLVSSDQWFVAVKHSSCKK